ncbi:MAG: carboxypeptidase-like regulatory domain-containing protein [Candidatus Eisenbacteria bacterium]
MRKLLTAMLAVLLLVAAVQALEAVPPTGAERPPEQGKTPEAPQFLKAFEGETSITGVVEDQNQTPLKDVRVKLFVDGLLVHSTTTDKAGTYQLRYPIDIGKDKTVMLWYVSPENQLVPKAVVLHESRAAATAGFVSPCIPRVQVKPFLEFRVQMVDIATRNRQLAQSGCLPSMSALPPSGQ